MSNCMYIPRSLKKKDRGLSRRFRRLSRKTGVDIRGMVIDTSKEYPSIVIFKLRDQLYGIKLTRPTSITQAHMTLVRDVVIDNKTSEISYRDTHRPVNFHRSESDSRFKHYLYSNYVNHGGSLNGEN